MIAIKSILEAKPDLEQLLPINHIVLNLNQCLSNFYIKTKDFAMENYEGPLPHINVLQ